MKKFKSIIVLTVIFSLFGAAIPPLSAQDNDIEYEIAAGGWGYTASRRLPSLAPTIALGTIALVAIIAVAMQNTKHSHGHHGHHGYNK